MYIPHGCDHQGRRATGVTIPHRRRAAVSVDVAIALTLAGVALLASVVQTVLGG